MWLLIFLYCAVTLLLSWIMFGYFVVVWFMGRFKEQRPIAMPEDATLPLITIIIPCYNEQEDIMAKIKNITMIQYPAGKLDIIFVDGGSTDKTIELIESNLPPSARLLKSPVKGKINQLNYAFKDAKGELVFNTDADAICDNDAFKWIVAEFLADPKVMVVGAYCKPMNCLSLENYYWAAQNKGRFIESDYYSSSIVTAPCYALKKDFINYIPEDVVADDIYVAYFVSSHGFRSVYSRLAKCIETRNPNDYNQFLVHKFRKCNAYIRETLRFMYRLPFYDIYGKIMITTRLAQLLLLPWCILFWLLNTAILCTFFRFDIVGICTLVLFTCFLICHWVFNQVVLPDNTSKTKIGTVIVGYFLTNIILFTAGISYPFFKQGSSYSRITATNNSGK